MVHIADETACELRRVERVQRDGLDAHKRAAGLRRSDGTARKVEQAGIGGLPLGFIEGEVRRLRADHICAEQDAGAQRVGIG